MKCGRPGAALSRRRSKVRRAPRRRRSHRPHRSGASATVISVAGRTTGGVTGGCRLAPCRCGCRGGAAPAAHQAEVFGAIGLAGSWVGPGRSTLKKKETGLHQNISLAISSVSVNCPEAPCSLPPATARRASRGRTVLPVLRVAAVVSPPMPFHGVAAVDQPLEFEAVAPPTSGAPSTFEDLLDHLLRTDVRAGARKTGHLGLIARLVGDVGETWPGGPGGRRRREWSADDLMGCTHEERDSLG